MDNNFHYNVIPSGGKVSARVVFQDDLTPEAIIAQAATDSGLTVAQVTAAGTSLLRQIILGARKGQRCRRLFGLMSFTPRCGGVHSDPDFQPTADNMNLSLNASLAPDGLQLFEEGITFQRDEVKGERAPQIDRVYDGATRLLNKCTPGGAFRVGGHDFGLEPPVASASLGVFLTPVAGGAAVRIASYSDWTATEIMGSWPAAITGAQILSVVTTYTGTGSARTGMYGTHLNP